MLLLCLFEVRWDPKSGSTPEESRGAERCRDQQSWRENTLGKTWMGGGSNHETKLLDLLSGWR